VSNPRTMGNQQSRDDVFYKEIPTQSYINYVVRKHKDVWEQTVVEDQKKVELEAPRIPKKTKKSKFISKFCCCFYSDSSELDEVYNIFLL